MNRFGRGNGSGGFAALLRSNGGRPVNKPNNAASTPGGKPEAGGSAGNRRPNDKGIQRHMDAKTSAGHQPGGASKRAGHAAKLDPEHRIARGPVGTSGRIIHHAPEKESAKMHPGKHISIGPHRSGTSSQKLSSTGRTKMSPEVSGRPGTPAHQSVINRGKRSGMARSLPF